jgi:hypothetical protein
MGLIHTSLSICSNSFGLCVGRAQNILNRPYMFFIYLQPEVELFYKKHFSSQPQRFNRQLIEPTLLTHQSPFLCAYRFLQVRATLFLFITRNINPSAQCEPVAASKGYLEMERNRRLNVEAASTLHLTQNMHEYINTPRSACFAFRLQ